MSRASASLRGMGGMPVSGSSDGASRTKAAVTAGWFGSRPAIIGRAPTPASDPPVRPLGQATPGMS